MSPEENTTGQNDPRIVRGRIDSLSLYEITDHELGVLEKGSPSSIYLNFGIFLLTIGLSFLTAILTTNIESIKVFIVFVVVSAMGGISGAFLIVLWYRLRGDVTDVAGKIRERITSQEKTSAILDESSN